MFKLRTTLRNLVRVFLILAAFIVVAGIVIDRNADEFTLQTAIGQTKRYTSNIRRFSVLGTRESGVY